MKNVSLVTMLVEVARSARVALDGDHVRDVVRSGKTLFGETRALFRQVETTAAAAASVMDGIERTVDGAQPAPEEATVVVPAPRRARTPRRPPAPATGSVSELDRERARRALSTRFREV
jgi:hypothetical protein